MKEKSHSLIEELPSKLGLPERYGKAAVRLAETLQLPVAEVERVYGEVELNEFGLPFNAGVQDERRQEIPHNPI